MASDRARLLGEIAGNPVPTWIVGGASVAPSLRCNRLGRGDRDRTIGGNRCAGALHPGLVNEEVFLGVAAELRCQVPAAEILWGSTRWLVERDAPASLLVDASEVGVPQAILIVKR